MSILIDVMTRKSQLQWIITLFCVCALPLVGAAAERHVTIGFVDPGSRSTTAPGSQAFWTRMHELGYVEGRNLTVEARWAEGKLTVLPDIMRDLLARKVDVIVTVTGPVALAAKQATQTTPIVATAVADALGAGLVHNLGRPGGNLTGLSLGWSQGLPGKWLQLLREVTPGLSTVAVTYNPDIAIQRDFAAELKTQAREPGLKLIFIDLRQPEQTDRAIQAASRQAQGLLVMPDPISVNNRARITELAAKHRLPAVYGLREFVDAGGLMSYGSDQAEMFRRTADYVDKIVKGANPGDLPIEQPTEYRLAVNLRAAKAVGIAFPESIMLRANDVVR